MKSAGSCLFTGNRCDSSGSEPPTHALRTCAHYPILLQLSSWRLSFPLKQTEEQLNIRPLPSPEEAVPSDRPVRRQEAFRRAPSAYPSPYSVLGPSVP